MVDPGDWEPEDPHLVGSPESVERPRRPTGGGWASALLAGLLAGVVLGWAGRGMTSSNERSTFAATPRGPTNLARDQGRRPWVIQAPDSGEPVPSLQTPKTPSPEKSPKTQPKAQSKPAAELPKGTLPLPGALSPVSPALSSSVKAVLDLHSAEARVRTIASEEGGRIVSVRDARGGADSVARSLVVSVAQERVKDLSDRIGRELGAVAMVEPPSSEPAPDDTGSIELRSEQMVLDQLKERVHQATLDFYPDAPALRTLEAQYADQMKKVDRLRHSLNGPVTVTVVLVGTAL